MSWFSRPSTSFSHDFPVQEKEDASANNLHSAAAYYDSHPEMNEELMRQINAGTVDPLNLPGIGNIEPQEHPVITGRWI